MGGKVIICVLCLLTLSKTLAKAVNSAVGIIDNVSAESVPRLYSDRLVGVYASANPYAASSFNVPTFIAPKNNVVPVKEENVVIQNVNGYLKDSYGQRFVQAPQTLAYRSTLPQQFVQLQNLPAHLSQPLVAATPNLHYAQETPHFFSQSFTRLPNLQAFSPTPINNLASPQQFIYSNNLRNLSPSHQISIQGHPTSNQQALTSNNVYANTHGQGEPKFQRIEEEPKVSATNDLKNQKAGQKAEQRNNLQLVQAQKENTNGKNTVVTLSSKSPVPLLDLTLLEPLRFANPIIPQVQHFLPRINNVKYQTLPEVEMVKKHKMEFIVQNTKSYDSDLNAKPKKESPKKKQRKQPPQSIDKDEEQVNETPTVTLHDNSNEGPELSYEINSPNYKETYTEKKISYNKETQSEPVHINYSEQKQIKPKHYAYEKRTEMKPINYYHVHSSKQPAQDNREHHNIPEEAPKQHVQNVQQEEKEQQSHYAPLPQNESEDSGESYDANLEQKHSHRHHENNGNAGEGENQDSNNNYERPKHQKVHYHSSESDDTPPSYNLKYPQRSDKGHSHPQNNHQHFQPIVPEYEEDIAILPTHKPHVSSHAPTHNNRQHKENHNRHSTPHNDDEQHHDNRNTYYSSAPIIVGKPKKGNNDESLDYNEELMSEMAKKQRENEQDFEKAYKDAAYGFPAYDTPSFDAEKHIYNPELYGASHYYKEYDIRKSPLRQYEADGDDFPNFTRSQYKNLRDKTNDEYFDRYVASKPESIAERNNKKEEYYQAFTRQTPEHYFANEQGDKNQKAKYTVAPSLNYNANPQRTPTFSKYQVASPLEEYEYSKEAPRDNSPHATHTFQRYKTKTHFVEPQYQYGFEPVSLPHLLDSEMAVMASILKPKKAKLGTKKKEFKENNTMVVKKTISRGAKATS